MKLLIIIVLGIILSSCKTSTGGHCDAYGKVESSIDKTNS